MQATFEKDTRVDNLKIFRDSKLEREQRVSFGVKIEMRAYRRKDLRTCRVRCLTRLH